MPEIDLVPPVPGRPAELSGHSGTRGLRQAVPVAVLRHDFRSDLFQCRQPSLQQLPVPGHTDYIPRGDQQGRVGVRLRVLPPDSVSGRSCKILVERFASQVDRLHTAWKSWREDRWVRVGEQTQGGIVG